MEPGALVRSSRAHDKSCLLGPFVRLPMLSCATPALVSLAFVRQKYVSTTLPNVAAVQYVFSVVKSTPPVMSVQLPWNFLASGCAAGGHVYSAATVAAQVVASAAWRLVRIMLAPRGRRGADWVDGARPGFRTAPGLGQKIRDEVRPTVSLPPARPTAYR